MSHITTTATPKQDGFANIITQLKGKRTGDNHYLCHCPCHRDKTASLSITKTPEGLLWHCLAGCDGRAVGRELRRIAGGQLVMGMNLVDVPAQPDEQKQEAIRRLWREGRPVEPGDPVHIYLTVTRRLPVSAIPPDLRYHPSHSLRTGERGEIDLGSHPTMIAAVRRLDGEIVQAHRTYLTIDGRKLSAVQPDLIPDWDGRKLMPRPYAGCLNGAAIRLGEVTDTVILSEGIETALAASLLSNGIPAWSCVTAGGLEKVELPNTVAAVYITVDQDTAGRIAANKLARRLYKAGKKVFFVPAPGLRKGADWADVVEGA